MCHQKFSEFLGRANPFVILCLSMNRSYRLFLLGNAERKGPDPYCQKNPRDCGKFSWIHYEEPDFNN